MDLADLRSVSGETRKTLKTGLGVLALVGISRDDGGHPVPAERIVLLATLVSLAALSHERLRPEDLALEQAELRS
jgi:two-component system sensor histidine kinase KdpD